MIAEDWTVTDVLSMLKSLGKWRFLLIALRR